MLRLTRRRGTVRRTGPRPLAPVLAVVLLSAVAGLLACSVNESGLEPSMPKLSHDAGAGISTGGSSGLGTGGSGTTAGTGGDGAGGTGQTGTGGSADNGGTGGTSVGAGGSGGLDAAGGAGGEGTGAGGVSPTGGAAGSGNGGAGGGPTGGAGGATGGDAGAGGSTGIGGRAGTGGTVGRCGPTNCTGCCAGTVCVQVPTARQCGSKGAACTACAACRTCSAAGLCALDPASQWTIVAESVRVTTTAPNGAFWDAARGDEGGIAPDLFCEYENPANQVSPTTAGVTDTVVDAYSASWNATITPAGETVSASALMATKPAWRIWVGDEDCSSPTVCKQGQSACSYQKPITAAQLMSGALSLTNVQNCIALNLQFVCASATP